MHGGDDNPPSRSMFSNEGLDADPALDIQRRDRFIQKPDRSVVEKQPGQGETPPLTGRQTPTRHPSARFEPHSFQRSMSRPLGLTKKTRPKTNLFESRFIGFHAVGVSEIVAWGILIVHFDRNRSRVRTRQARHDPE